MLRILLIDDNPNDRLLAIRDLQQEFPNLEVNSVINAKEFDQALFAGNFDLVITDYQIGWTDGLAVLNAVKARYPDCPIVMFTDSGSEEVAVEGLKAGLSDYVLKSQHFRRLAIAVRESLEKNRLRQEYATALEQLRVSEERLSLALEAGQLGTCDWNILTGHVTWSENHELLFGLPPGRFNGTYDGFLACVHPEDRDLITQAVSRALETSDYNQEFRVLWPDGSVHWIIGKGQFFYDQSGQPTRMIGVVLDISERKQREAELQRYAEELMQANRLKDEFLAIVSHELRTPLNAILGWTQLLLSRNFDNATKIRSLQTIERNAIQQKQLIEDILDVSRLIRGQIQLQVSAVDLVSVIENAINSVDLSATANSIKLESVLERSIGRVLGDENRLQQIVWNLLSNAIKFTPPGGRVTVWLHKVDNYAQISVSDTGKGITPDFLPYVFDRFRQADSSSTRSHNGLGLGLAIVRQLVELQGGTVQVESPGEGQGATFIVNLPLAPVPEKISNNSPLPAPVEDEISFTKTQLLKGLQVLVVDDSPDILELVVIILESNGAEVSAAASVDEALQILKELEPDILVSDVAMPKADGYTLLEQVRLWEAQRGKHIPAIALTGYARDEDRTQALAASFQMHLSKPVEPSELVQAIASLTGRAEKI
jgi:PAS domain S-box-containing protein